MALERGLPIERAVDDLSSVEFPGFVDGPAFRAALLETAELQLRTEFEARVGAVRQRLQAPGSIAEIPSAVVVEGASEVTGHMHDAPATESPTGPEAERDLDDLDPTTGTEPAGASDETAIWSVASGRAVRRQPSDY
jgi:hypothetical protein